MTTTTKKAELLMPAGNLEKLKTAILYGADAIYMGTPDMSLRTKSEFTLEEVVEGINFAHSYGKRVYLTLNLFSHNKDIDKLPKYVETVRKVKPDGLIVADPGVFMFVKEAAPELELHVSTQANVCSWQSVKFWEKQGAKLCVLGREVSFLELAEIREKCPDIKLEAFVHGSMCMTYSGRCMLSNYMAERGANQGACANSCRWNYKVHMKLKDGTVKELNLTPENMEMFEWFLEEGNRPGEMMPIEEDERGTYILNAKDLCIMPKLEDYLTIGVDSLKVEGRGKSPYYVGIVARAYRMAIDDWYEDKENWNAQKYMDELATVPNRGYTYAFHEGRLTNHAHGYEETGTLAEWEYGGFISEVTSDALLMKVKNKIEKGDVLEFVSPTRRDIMRLRIYDFEDVQNDLTPIVVHPGNQAVIRLPFSLFDKEEVASLKVDFPAMTIVRKEKSLRVDQWDRIKLDKEARRFEEGGGNVATYEKQRDKLQASIDEAVSERSFKTPRIGVDGCCGKGCNGCTIFWYDPQYAKARDILASKKQGEMLDEDMIEKEAV